MLRLEFALHALRDPRLRERLARQLASNRELLCRLLTERADQAGVQPALPAAHLGTIIRAIGIGLAMEKLVNPQDIPNALYADAISWILECAGLGEA